MAFFCGLPQIFAAKVLFFFHIGKFSFNKNIILQHFFVICHTFLL